MMAEITPSQSLLKAILFSQDVRLFRALQEGFYEADKIPGCDAATRALFNALYQGGLCESAALDQRTGGQYHDAIQLLTTRKTAGHLDNDAEAGFLAMAEVVRERDRQALIGVCSKAISDLSSGAKPESVSDEIGTALKAVRTTTGAPTLDEYVSGSISELRRLAESGVELKSGLAELDSLFVFRRANLTTIGARTSHGKTAFATRMVCLGLRASLGVAYLCFEDYGTWLMKFASQFSQAPLEKFTKYHLSSKSDRVEAENALELCRQFTNLTVVPGMRMSEFANVVEKLPKKPDVLVFDYLQKHVEMFGSEDRRAAASKATSDFQELCRKLNAFGIMTSQISRAPQEMRQKPPVLEGLKESGDIESYSDAVLLLHYPWRDSLDGTDLSREKYKIIVAKDKLGSCGTVELRFKGETLTLFDRFTSEGR